MKERLFILAYLTFFLIALSSNSFAKEKLVYYTAGALTAERNKFVHEFECQGNRNYKIIFGFINYSDGMLNLFYRENTENLKTITIEGQHGKKEMINLSMLRSGKLPLEIKAGFGEARFSFVSFEIMVIEED